MVDKLLICLSIVFICEITQYTFYNKTQNMKAKKLINLYQIILFWVYNRAASAWRRRPLTWVSAPPHLLSSRRTVFRSTCSHHRWAYWWGSSSTPERHETFHSLNSHHIHITYTYKHITSLYIYWDLNLKQSLEH